MLAVGDGGEGSGGAPYFLLLTPCPQIPLALPALWDVLTALPRLRVLNLLLCFWDPPEAVTEAPPPAMSKLIALTGLFLSMTRMPHAVTALPALRRLRLEFQSSNSEAAQEPGWLLPPGPYLSQLVGLSLHCMNLGSLAAVWSSATGQNSLDIWSCDWLEVRRGKAAFELKLGTVYGLANSSC